MKNATLFAFAATLTACITFSSLEVIGNADPTPERPLGQSGKALMDGCEVTGTLVRKHDGIYAVINCVNPTDTAQTTSFHIAAHETAGSSPLSRMLPTPALIKQHKLDCRLAAGERISREILVRSEVAPQTTGAATPGQPKLIVKDGTTTPPAAALARILATTPPTWSLTVAKQPVTNAPGWGGSAPVAISTEATVLGEGQLVLTRTLTDSTAGTSS